MKLYLQEYREKNKETLREKSLVRHKLYYENNKETVSIRHKKYRKNNREKINTYFKKRREVSISYRIMCSLRARVRLALKTNAKTGKTVQLLGCTAAFLKEYLESKFLPTMSWENYGDYWHIDHIIPCSNFDLSKEEDQQKCFHYTNLQPLFAVTQIINGITYIGNINKNDKIL